MVLSFLPHVLGVICILYALQLLRQLYFDFKGKGFGAGLMALCAGILAIILAVAIVVAVDYFLPVGSIESEATFFVRIVFLIPLAYLAAYIAGTILGAVLGNAYPISAVSHTALLGVTLLILAPITHMWVTALLPRAVLS